MKKLKNMFKRYFIILCCFFIANLVYAQIDITTEEGYTLEQNKEGLFILTDLPYTKTMESVVEFPSTAKVDGEDITISGMKLMRSEENSPCRKFVIPASYTTFIIDRGLVDVSHRTILWPNLEEIEVSAENSALYSKDGVLYTAGALLWYPAAKKDNSIELPAETKEVLLAMNPYIESITNVSSLEKFTSVGCEKLALPAGENLKSINIVASDVLTNLNLENVSSVTLSSCDNITEISVNNKSGKCDVEVTNLVALKKLILGDSVSWVYLRNLPALTTLDVADENKCLRMEQNGLINSESHLIYVPEGYAAGVGDFTVPESVTQIDYLPNVNGIAIPGEMLKTFNGLNNENYPTSLFGDLDKLMSLQFGDCKECDVDLSDVSFTDCHSLMTVVFPKSPRSIKINDKKRLSAMFMTAKELTGDGFIEMYLPQLNTVSIPTLNYTINSEEKAYRVAELFGIEAETHSQLDNSIGAGGYYIPAFKSITITNQNSDFAEDALNLKESDVEIILTKPVDEISEVFKNSNLAEISLSGKVKEVGEDAFSGCRLLKKISVYSEIPPMAAASAFEGVDKSKCKLVVPVGSESAYRKADVWKEFMNISADGTVNIDEISDATEFESARYFNLQGVEVINPSNGLFIVVKGGKVTKEIIR